MALPTPRTKAVEARVVVLQCSLRATLLSLALGTYMVVIRRLIRAMELQERPFSITTVIM